MSIQIEDIRRGIEEYCFRVWIAQPVWRYDFLYKALIGQRFQSMLCDFLFVVAEPTRWRLCPGEEIGIDLTHSNSRFFLLYSPL